MKFLASATGLALGEALEVLSPDGDGARAVAEDGVSAGLIEQSVLVIGVLMLGEGVLSWACGKA